MENQLAYLIPIIAIIGGITYAIFAQHFRTQRRIAEAAGSPALVEALALSRQASSAMLARMDALEARLGTLEKAADPVS